MASSENDSTWRVLAHGPIEKLSDNLWRVKGAVPHMSLERVMTVVRKRDGALIIHSAIALEESAMRELEAWGTPTYLIVPNRGHRLDAARYRARYPALRVFAPRGGLEKIAQVVKVDGTFEQFPSDDEVRLEMLHGVGDGEGAMIVRSEDGVTVVLNDAVMNMDHRRDLVGALFTRVMGSAPGPRVSRLAKLVYVKDRKALRADLERYAQLPSLVRLIVSHDKVAHGSEAARALRKAASYL